MKLAQAPWIIVLALAACKDGPPPVVVPVGRTPDGDAGDASVSVPTPTASPEAGVTAPTALTMEDSGKPVMLSVGASLIVKLGTNAGNGFAWEVAKNDESILSPRGEPKTEGLDEAEMGGRIRRVFSFVAHARGSSHLEIVLHRPWEKKPPLRTFAIDVTVE